MTTIVAVKAGNRIAIAADTLVSCNGERIETVGTKLVQCGGGTIGFACNSVIKDLFETYLDVGCGDDPLVDRASIFKLFLAFWRWAKADAHLVKDDARPGAGGAAEVDGTFLVAIPSGIFSVGCDLSVLEHPHYWAIGAGEDYALGALHQMGFFDTTATAKHRAERAVETASVFNLGTGGPVESHDMACWAKGHGLGLAAKSDKELWEAGDGDRRPRTPA